MNVIFVVVDDLNDYIEGFGGHPQVQTPNLKSLSERGYLFTNAFCNAPVCAPSRTSLLSGKDLLYTNIYANNNYLENFRQNFTAANNNEEVITLPEHLKNIGGYYTVGVNKVFHKPFNTDFDTINNDPCAKELSWSRVSNFSDNATFTSARELYTTGLPNFVWGVIPDSLEEIMKDYRSIDTTIKILEEILDGTLPACGKPFFLALGIDAPHLDLYFPEKYFPEFYLSDFYTDEFHIPFNYPTGTYPANGIIMPPQPDTIWNDYYTLGPLAQAVSTGQIDIELSISQYMDTVEGLPEINPDFTDSLRSVIFMESIRANAVMAYIAGVQYMDAQIGRLIEFIESKSEIYDNTIIVFIGDNGFTMGEKRHWQKRSLWEPDVRVPFIIVDPRKEGNATCAQTVGLIDLFPTICALTGTPMPTFSDGSNYLDGISIAPILEKTERYWERPVLISFSSENNQEGSCNPQLAVRSERFKYIKYTSDGGNPEHDCNHDSTFIEQELYEIGKNREVDPNEWNNLIKNNDYQPVKEYLSQWLPDSVMYLKDTYTLRIKQELFQCLYAHNDSLTLAFDLYDTNGNLIEAPADYQYQWSNNLSNQIIYTTNAVFSLNLINPIVFSAADEIIVYAKMIDTIQNAIVGFDIQTIKTNANSEPVINFNATMINEFTVDITNTSITGIHNAVYWDFGDGYVFEGENPGSHIYDSAGIFQIKCYTSYGNFASCQNESTQTITAGMPALEQATTMIIYPVPSSSYINIFMGNNTQAGKLFIKDVTGKIVMEKTMQLYDYPLTSISLTNLAKGMYYVIHQNSNSTQISPFVLIKTP